MKRKLKNNDIVRIKYPSSLAGLIGTYLGQRSSEYYYIKIGDDIKCFGRIESFILIDCPEYLKLL